MQHSVILANTAAAHCDHQAKFTVKCIIGERDSNVVTWNLAYLTP